MNSRPSPLPEHELSGHGARRRWRPRFRDAPIRSKLTLILVLPIAVALALGAVRVVDLGREARAAELTHSLTALRVEVSALGEGLHRERMAAAGFLAGPDVGPDAYNGHVRRSDERIAAYRALRDRTGDVPAAAEDRLRMIDHHLSTVNNIRQEVLDRQQMPTAEALLRYGVILADLAAYGETLDQLPATAAVARGQLAVSAFARARLATAEEQTLSFTALSVDQLTADRLATFLGALSSRQEALLAFSRVAGAQEQKLVRLTVSGEPVDRVDQIVREVSRSVGQPLPVSPTEFGEAVGELHGLMREAEIRLESDLLATAERAWQEARWWATLESVVLLLALVVAITLAVLLARRLNNAVRRLSDDARRASGHDLPEAVSRLRNADNLGEGGSAEVLRQARDPIRLTDRDELGQVAKAFNAVQQEAVRTAADRAELQASVAAIFRSLARRNQTLVARMVAELAAIERGEDDPKRLARLFELDHLATRMRRNDENLLVLAGADSATPRQADALLVDTMRAAQSEVELYHRIDFGTVDADIAIAAHAVNDVVRMVAELMDNATRFSPPDTLVVADARRIRDHVLIEVEDRGLGLSDEQLSALNARLAGPVEVDVAAFRLMGLAVVSRLAARYGIRVELRRTIEGGTVAQVTLPSSTVVLPRAGGREPLTRARPPLAAVAAASGGDLWPSRAPALGAVPAGAMLALPASVQPMVDAVPVLPAGPVAGAAAATKARPVPGREPPVYRGMEAVWFHAQSQDFGSGAAGADRGALETPALGSTLERPPPEPYRPPAASTSSVAAVSPAVPTSPMGQPSTGSAVPASSTVIASTNVSWRTAADDGWLRASQAAEPAAGGTTPSGLPKRVPQAQLVPGGVAAGSSGDRTRRTPDEVRGLLSAYHRGVQRGRSAGDVQDGTTSTKETSG